MYNKPIFSYNIARKTAKVFTANVIKELLFNRQAATSAIKFTHTS
jgi:hypothetical protein